MYGATAEVAVLDSAIARCLRYRDMNQAQLLTGTEAGAAIAVRRLWREAADQPPARLVPDASAWRSDLCKSPAVRERVATRRQGLHWMGTNLDRVAEIQRDIF